MGLRSLKQKLAKRLSVSGHGHSNSASGPSTSTSPSSGRDTSSILPPAYEDVPVFANPAPPERIPFLPYEIITDIIYWAITPAFDEYRQHESAIHVQTLHHLAAVSPAFLSIVRRICREAPEIPPAHRSVPCRDAHHGSVCTFETAAAWMPISVLAGIFQLNIFDKDRKYGKTIARVQGFQPNLTALIFLLWNRQAMERVEGVPRRNIYLPYPISFATHNHHRSINKFNIVLKALANCRHLKFCYVRLSVPALYCSAQHLLEAIRTIAPTRYLEVNMHILGWGDGEEHPAFPGFCAKLPFEILKAGLARGASRVDIHDFRLDDRPVNERSKELPCPGSMVHFIRSRPIPDGVVTLPNGGGVFAQLVIKGDLEFSMGLSAATGDGGRIATRGLLKSMAGNKVVVNPFMYYLTAVKDGQFEWIGDGEKFTTNHFRELSLRDDLRTVEGRMIEDEWMLDG
ncbi:hypothetical protein TWF106_002850 [Orbilia oligospora]|uniref:Uncharacterized protein n=1 Tax=Orbilia oligospora TaxID=2813651 RepID=A0A6G1M5Y6_ORBOL|nr:hypothetical protein TWF106_002850 [Orbilia oligospora]KAF3218006.1 hypothetical protein TWF679_001419 [Orbilia oligospora]KAF3218704.1 hypothetical protein TWF191_008149 [Orbilia oligospora]KAF3244224.1 hypothetical protein TWF192_007785 [Orbilia oligospora]